MKHSIFSSSLLILASAASFNTFAADFSCPAFPCNVSEIISKPADCTNPEALSFTPFCLVPHIITNADGSESLDSDIYEINFYPQRGAIFAGSQAEPHLAVNPQNSNNIAVSWIQDRAGRQGGGEGLGGVISTDGGLTWTQLKVGENLPAFTRAAGAPDQGAPGSYDRATDPWFTFSNDGKSLFFSTNNFDGRIKHVGGALSIAKSSTPTPGDPLGLTWGPVINVTTKGGIGIRAIDKPTTTVDPNNSSIVYATYVIYATGDAKNDIYLGKSINGGATWTTKKILTLESNANQGAKEQSQLYPELKILPNGTLVQTFIIQDAASFDDTVSYKLALIRSFDNGATWEKNLIVIDPDITPKLIFDPTLLDASGTTVPVRGSQNWMVSLSLNSAGDLYVVYGDGVSKATTSPEIIKLTRIQNLGNRNFNPVGSVTTVTVSPTTENAFMPVVNVAANGTVGVAYFQIGAVNDAGCTYSPSNGFTRNGGTEDCPFPANVYLKQFSADLSASTAAQLLNTNAIVDIRKAPLLFGPGGAIPGGLFLGDYFGISSAAGNFLIAYPGTDNAVRTCELISNDAAGVLITPSPQTVGAIFFPEDPNAIASNHCNRTDVFFTKAAVLTP